jgi:hypothetical protein
MPRIGTAPRNGSTVLGRSRPAWKRRTRAEGVAAAGLDSALCAVLSKIVRPGREDPIRPNQKMDLGTLLIGCCLIALG